MKKLYSILFLMMLALSSIANAQESTGVVNNYPGYLNVTILDTETGESMPVAENESNTITITEYTDGTCDFLLPNFALSAMELELGNILVEGATVTKNEEGIATYNGFVKDMPLLGGELIADVTLDGTITADGVVNMKIDVLWEGIPIACTFTTNEVVAGEVTEYPGYLNVTILDPETGESMPVAENESNTITITEYADGTCDFLLPNFALSTMELELGDILVEGATVTRNEEGIATYNGFVKDMPLLGGELIADVTLGGTITADGVVNMKIDVLWEGIPIACTFTSTEISGIENVVVAEQGEVEYYNLHGVKVVNPENGVFIRAQGGKVTKVVK
ncbi:MAG: calycin-like domain-containing protein [Muribaculaceae bacterium]|nr:calycin-like domain-containing protein [Muribaculaceae bacterium]